MLQVRESSLKNIFSKVEKVPGWFDFQDCQALFDLVKQTKHGKIVEVGTFLGRSTTLIASMKPVVCIDPMRLEYLDENALHTCLAIINKQSNLKDQILGSRDFYPLFEKFCFKLLSRITLIRDRDKNIWGTWDKGAIDLLVLDHEHTKEAVRDSLLGWKPHLSPGARIFIHDCVRPELVHGIKEAEATIEKGIKNGFGSVICRFKNFKKFI